ncbi:hypothetical protein HPP92_008727 [Vanilla planifolia]|uniref:Uncharacterized protein n=1 Tax=Vanilla planifolia TaxID=51239 RepID=A0A835RIB1_VANPL|nr:hypothetical protein HPP92_008727 [Vanilla planifolia]
MVLEVPNSGSHGDDKRGNCNTAPCNGCNITSLSWKFQWRIRIDNGECYVLIRLWEGIVRGMRLGKNNPLPHYVIPLFRCLSTILFLCDVLVPMCCGPELNKTRSPIIFNNSCEKACECEWSDFILVLAEEICDEWNINLSSGTAQFMLRCINLSLEMTFILQHSLIIKFNIDICAVILNEANVLARPVLMNRVSDFVNDLSYQAESNAESRHSGSLFVDDIFGPDKRMERTNKFHPKSRMTLRKALPKPNKSCAAEMPSSTSQVSDSFGIKSTVEVSISVKSLEGSVCSSMASPVHCVFQDLRSDSEIPISTNVLNGIAQLDSGCSQEVGVLLM